MPAADCLRSRLLSDAGFSHAFFTRRGGVSEGPFRSLNFSIAVGDASELVAENVRRAAVELGISPERVYYVSQVHGAGVVMLVEPEPRELTASKQGDVLVSALAGVACGVRSADCVPILLGDARSGAVAAVHAGWRGVVAGAVRTGVERLSALSAGPVELVAAIGPHISEAAFEVSPDVAAELQAVAPAVPAVEAPEGRKPRVALRALVRAQLEQAGVPSRAIDDVPGCTVRDPELFFSYRRDGRRSGRHLSAIVPRVPG